MLVFQGTSVKEKLILDLYAIVILTNTEEFIFHSIFACFILDKN